MNFFTLSYFIVLASELNFSRAAEKLFISQQALSKHIKNMEREYKTQFFNRKPKMSLTRSGEIMLQMAIDILELQNQGKAYIEVENKRYSGHLTVGMGRVRCQTILLDLFPEFHRHYPNVDLRVVIDKATVLENMLHSNEIDLWLGYYALRNEKFHYTFLYKDQLCLVVSKKLMSDLFGRDSERMAQCFETGLDISYFKYVPFLLVSQGARQRDFIDYYFKKNHVAPHIALEVDDNEALMLLAFDGNYVTFTPIALIRRYRNFFEGKKAYSFPVNDNSLQQDIIISNNPSKPLSAEAQNFIALCYELFHQSS